MSSAAAQPEYISLDSASSETSFGIFFVVIDQRVRPTRITLNHRCLLHVLGRANKMAHPLTTLEFNTMQAKPERQYRPQDLFREKLVPFSAPTLYRRIKDGSFPRPAKCGWASFWSASQIAEWQAAQREAVAK
jgi:prophage regulatory protein